MIERRRPGWRELSPPLTTTLIALALVGEVLWAALGLTGRIDLSPHGVPAVVAADPVVAESIVRAYDDLPGDPFALRAVPDEATARAALADGSAQAALVVDLTGATDRLLLPTSNDPALDTAVRDRVTRVEQSLGRQVEVATVGPAVADGTRADAYRAVTLSILLGFVVAVGTSLYGGPVVRGRRHGLRRSLLVAGLAIGVGGLLGLWLLGSAAAALACATVALTSAAVALALEALFGWAGLGLSVALFLATGAAVLVRVDPLLVGQPWSTISGLGMPGAGLETALAAGLHDTVALAPLSVVLSWLTTSVLLAGASRWVRGRHDVPVPVAGTPLREIAGERGWRVRVVALVAPPVVTMLALSVVVPAHQVAAAPQIASLAASSSCVATGSVRTVADLNRITQLRGTEEFRGGDVGADALLQDGRRVWLFGDTIQDGSAGPGGVRNSMLITDDRCIRAVVPEGGGALIPDRADGTGPRTGYWPMSVVVDHRTGYDLLYITTQRVRTTGSGAFDFENLGLSVAVVAVPPGGTPQVLDRRDIGPDRPGRENPTWGAATALVGEGRDRWLYLYGTANPGLDQAWGYSLRVARVRLDDLLHADRWRYWTGSSWSPDAADATEVIPARDGVSQTLSVFTRDGRWYALSKRNDLLGSDITVWTAAAPTGPWSSGTAVAAVPQGSTGQLRYMPLAHPTLFPEDGTVVASYSTNDIDVHRVLEDPRRYRPHFVRVRLPR